MLKNLSVNRAKIEILVGLLLIVAAFVLGLLPGDIGNKVALKPGSLVQLTGNNKSYFADWSKDGKHILYVTDSAQGLGMWCMSVAQGDSSAEYLGEGDNPRYSPDNKWIAYTTNFAYSLWIMEAANPSNRWLVEKGDPNDTFSSEWLSNNKLAIKRWKGSKGIQQIAYDPITKEREYTYSNTPGYALSPNGIFRINSWDGMTGVSFELESVDDKIKLYPTDIFKKLSEGTPVKYAEIDFWSWSPDSHKLLVVIASDTRRSSYELKLVTISDGNKPSISVKSLVTLPPNSPNYFQAKLYPITWSPDSKRIAYQKRYPNTTVKLTKDEVVVMDLESNQTVSFDLPYTGSQCDIRGLTCSDYFRFSPDGKALVFSSGIVYGFKLNIIHPDGNIWVYYFDNPTAVQPMLNPTVPVSTPSP